ncbi:MAG: deoxycytidylate deaminase [Chitinivibrionales bacterium]
MKLLEKNNKPKFPGLSALRFEVDEKRHSKLSRSWDTTSWEFFVSIEVAKVIFMFAIHRAVHCDTEDDFLTKIRDIVKNDHQIFGCLDLLTIDESELSDKGNALSLIEAYKRARRLFGIFKTKCTDKMEDFIEIMQNFGDQIRQYGHVLPVADEEHSPANMLILPEAIRRLIKAYRIAHNERHFVIDAFRNPYEVEFFKRRYNEFYLIAVQRPQDEIKRALKNMSDNAVDKIQNRERGGKGEDGKSKEIHKRITSQNIEECLQKADIFINNIYDNTTTYPNLRYHLIRFLCLAKLPGVIPPDCDERHMQLAMTAKQNSGCLSRHVGAIVVNKKGYVLGVGWNDPPRGQIPCTFRTASALTEGMDPKMFSDYETSSTFIAHIESKNYGDTPFCFKDEYKTIKSKSFNEFTRSVHAEENALLQALANSSTEHLEGGTIYTTDSPCTLCSKKAYQLGIERIVYIEEYPGIAMQQTLNIGEKAIRQEQFQGITGSAYFRLFSSLMNEKDFLELK